MYEFVIGALVVVAIIVVVIYVSMNKLVRGGNDAGTTVGKDATSASVAAGVAPPASEAPAWSREEGMNYVWGQVAPGQGSGDGNVKFLGITGSAGECEKSCASAPWCHGYTWADATNGAYTNTCYGVNNIRIKVPEPHHTSGTKEGFSATLMRRMGTGDAGKDHFSGTSSSTFGSFDGYKQNFIPAAPSTIGSFDAMKQNFVAAASDVAQNTMWSGHQHSAVLPI